MVGRKVDSTRPATVAEVLELLEAEKEKRELSFEQQTTLDYARKIAKTTGKAAKAMEKELLKMEKLTPDTAAKIVDLLPSTKEQLNAIVSKERYTLTEKEVGQILDILKKGAGARPRIKPAEPPATEEDKKEEAS